jgi:hypothetical protein
MNDILYMPKIPDLFVTAIHYLPRTTWRFVEAIVGYDKNYHIDLGDLPMMARNDVGGTSTKNMMHWTQNVRSGQFRMYDYGSQGNMAAYG